MERTGTSVFGYLIYIDQIRYEEVINPILRQAPKLKEDYFAAWQAICEEDGNVDYPTLQILVEDIVEDVEDYGIVPFFCRAMREITGFDLDWMEYDGEMVIGIEMKMPWELSEEEKGLQEEEAVNQIRKIESFLPEAIITYTGY